MGREVRVEVGCGLEEESGLGGGWRVDYCVEEGRELDRLAEGWGRGGHWRRWRGDGEEMEEDGGGEGG